MMEPLFAVITLPVLAPIVALLQLLFPSLMRNQYQQYKVVIHTLLAQSTLMFIHWVTVQWFVKQRSWWVSDEALSLGLLLIAAVGLVVALNNRVMANKSDTDLASGPPARLEYIALALFAATGVGWAFYQRQAGGSFLDPMFALTIACVVGLVHLALRSGRSAAKQGHRRFVSTELAFLATAVLVGVGMAAYQRDTSPQQVTDTVKAEWSTYRGDPQRTGSRNPLPISNPKLLWTFDPQEKKGFVRMHSSPAVVDNQLYIGAMHEVLTFTEGILYCVNIGNGTSADGKPLKPGELLWKFTANSTLKPVFSSPSIAEGKLYFGEGYHQDSQCRVFCLDASNGTQLFARATQSHVESSPAIVNEQFFVGAGDDGVISYSQHKTSPLWQRKQLHVDAAPLVADGKVIVGSVQGDIHKDYAIVAIDTVTGEDSWRLDAPMPVPGPPSLAVDGGSVYVGLGRGKMDHDDDQPAGAVWRIYLATGGRRWEFPLPNAVLGSPVALEGKVLFGCRDGFCYCVDDKQGDLLWKHDCGDAIVTSPALGAGQAIVMTTAGVLLALDLETGQEQWRFDELKTDDLDAYSSPVIVGRQIFVAVGGKVHCVGME